MNLKEIAQRARRIIIESSYQTKACHIGSALSAVDILVDLYFRRMKREDLFIFSKASGVAALYAVLALRGFFSEKKVVYYLKKYPLPSKKVPGVLISGGSCGHGLPIAVGMALADRQFKGYLYDIPIYLSPKIRTIWCLMSDGELQEGTTWESLLFKRQHKLDNLKIIVDNNGWQACGRIEDILDIPWNFLKFMGVERIKTIKGKGISFMEREGNVWHYKNLDENTYQAAIHELADKKGQKG